MSDPLWTVARTQKQPARHHFNGYNIAYRPTSADFGHFEYHLYSMRDSDSNSHTTHVTRHSWATSHSDHLDLPLESEMQLKFIIIIYHHT